MRSKCKVSHFFMLFIVGSFKEISAQKRANPDVFFLIKKFLEFWERNELMRQIFCLGELFNPVITYVQHLVQIQENRLHKR